MKNLKKIIVPIILLLSTSVSAQLTVGIKGGFTRAWQNYGDVNLPDEAVTHVNKFNVSLLGYYEINKWLQIGLEPGYIERGAACVPGWNFEEVPEFLNDSKFFLNYIELPMMVQSNISFCEGKFDLFGKIGYGASIIVKAVREDIFIDTDIPNERSNIELGGNSILNRWDHGIYSSLGFGFNFAKSQIFVATDYYLGFRDAERFNTSKNRGLNFNIGYKFQL